MVPIVNYYEIFLDLTYLLMDKLRESAPSRLVVVSSALHARSGVC